MHSSQVDLNSQKEDARVCSALPFSRNYRTQHAVSTHSGMANRKILPKSRIGLKKSEPRRSESTHVNKTSEKSLIRFKKLDVSVG